MVRQMNLQQVQPPIDGLDQTRAPRQQVHGPDPAGPQPADPIRQFVLNVPGAEHRPGLICPDAVPQPPLNSPFSIAQFSLAFRFRLCSIRAHLKCLLAFACQRLTQHILREFQGISSTFFEIKRTNHA